MRWTDLVGARVLIVGIGAEGAAAATALDARGIQFLATDDNDGEAAAQWRLRWPRHELVIGADAATVLSRTDVVLKSPGISPRHPLVAHLAAAGKSITSGTDLWLSENAARTTGITGSKGKSTTASLIHALQCAAGVESELGGNIGVPLLAMPSAANYVVELSSYQCQSLHSSPQVAVLTALFPEHLDWHGGETQYYRDKLNIVRHAPHAVVVNAEDPRLSLALADPPYSALPLVPVGGSAESGVRLHEGEEWVLRRGEPILPVRLLPLRGRHNAINVSLALAAVAEAGIELSAADAATALTAFTALPHRLEYFTDSSGLNFVDDSLSTSPFAAIEALAATGVHNTTLLVGGHDRGVDYAPLAEYLERNPIAAVVGLPGSGARILAELAGTGIPSHLAESMVDAVLAARRMTPVGGTILLSPAAPSYGVYRNYAERAADFRRAVGSTEPEHTETENL